MSTMGYWREPLMNLQAGDKLEWQAPGPLGLKVWIGLLHGRAVARINRQPGHVRGCSGKLDGWIWTDMEPGSGAAQLGVKESQYRGFKSVPAAKQAIEAAVAAAKV